MTPEPELRYVSVSMYHIPAHAVRDRRMVTVCGVELDERQVERMVDRVTCKTCQALLDARGELVPA